ncbi:MAG TPA: PA14 domain-containing protein [Candidatus Limnocylindrales bacterium]
MPRRKPTTARLVTLAVLPGLLMLPALPANAKAAAPPEPRPMPATSEPLRPATPTIPAGDGTLSVPEDWDAQTPRRVRNAAKDRLRTPGREVPEKRDRTTEVFDNGDGSETVRLYAGPVHFQRPGSKVWEKIDNNVVPDPASPGRLVNSGNDWRVRFEPLTGSGAGGVQLEQGGKVTRWVPDRPAGARPIVPTAKANTVTYADVWPGVDIRYTVSNTKVTEEIIGDAENRESPSEVSVTVHDGQKAEKRSATGFSSGGVTINQYMAPTATCAFSTVNEVWCDGISTGTFKWPPQHWWLRSIAQFNYRPWVENRQLIKAELMLANPANPASTPYEEVISVWDATSHDFGGAVAHGNQAYLLDMKVVVGGGCYWGLDACFDVTHAVYSWQLNGVFNGLWDDGTFGLGPDEEGLEFLERKSYKNYDTPQVYLELNVNLRPAPPVIVGPKDGSLAIETLTPTLKWSPSTDGDGDPVKYTAKISTSPDGETGAVATSPETTGLEWTVPAGVLRDGITYYWKVFANDTKAWVPSSIQRLTVDRRLGAGGASPIDNFSGVITNLVSGNMSVSVDGPDLQTVGGGIEVDLVYNGKPALTGLRGSYVDDKNKNQVIDAGEPTMLVRTDSSVAFNWDHGSPSPAVPVDYFLVTWTGTVRTPPGNWQFGVRADDGTRIWIDGVKALDSWGALSPAPVYQAGSVNGLRRIQFDYYEHSAPAYVELWVRNAANPAQAFVVPPDWLSPDSQDLPPGWSIQAADAEAAYTKAAVTEASIALTEADGSALSFTKQPNGGYKPPEGVDDMVSVGSDGRVAVHDDAGMSYVFRPDGGLESVTSAVDDRHPAAARYAYDNLARLKVITDPVSTRQVVLHYAASDGDANCPNVPPLASALDFQAATGMLCRVSYWDGTSTDLYYFKSTDLLAHIVEPGDVWWSYSYDSQGRIIRIADPTARDAYVSGARTDTDPLRLWTQIAYTGDGLASRVQSVTAPAAMQADTQRSQNTYTYQPNSSGGMLIDGSAAVTRAGVAGTALTIRYDYRGRETERTNALGHTSRSYWDHNDLVVATESADGLLTSTFYNARHQPVDVWGPAPKDWFNKVWYVSDYFFPKEDKKALIPHNVNRYDEGLDGLEVKWWNNISMHGPVIAHQFNSGWLREGFAGEVPVGVNADSVAAKFTGDIVFGAPGEYRLQICAGDNDLAGLLIDDVPHTDVWAVPTLKCSAPTTWPFKTGAAGEVHRIQVNYHDLGGADLLHLNWTRPDGVYEPVPASALRPGYSLLTSTVDEDNRTSRTEYADPANGIGPQHGLPVRTVVDPGGLNLTGSVTYEAPGAGRFLRPLSRTLPSGAGSRTSSTYYGNTETRDNPCTTAVDPASQGGMLKLDTAADPDGTGSLTPVVREVVYDNAGRVVATRSSTSALTATDWVCTTYDARGRATQVKYPAFGGEPARTLTNSYLVDPDGTGPRPASPLISSTSDAAGTIVNENDLLGRDISYKDVFGNTTLFKHDLANREIENSGPAGTITRTYDSLDRITSVSRNGTVLANNLVYDNAGKLRSAAYPGSKGTFDFDPTYGWLRKLTWTGAGGALLASDEVTRSLTGDLKGQLIDGVDHHAGNDFSYDAAGRLTDAWVPGARYQFHFLSSTSCPAPDAHKNTNRARMTVTPTGGTAAQTNYCYDHADRLTSSTDPAVGTVGYDSHGNTTAVFGQTHGYDSGDRHVTTVKGTTTIRYVRDATGRIVERKLNGVTTARYGSTGEGDTPDFTTNASNQVQEVIIPLPGGVLLTTRTAGNVWSYPNSQGHIVAVADQAGVKQGTTRVYDPFGRLVSGTMPDNSAGDLDYGWQGQHQRPVEHQAGLQPIIEMGARQYSSLLGRFLEVDPVDGGSSNDYEYCNADPFNCTDLDGQWGIPKFVKKIAKKAKKFVKKAAKVVSRNMDLISLVCKVCGIAYGAFTCARKRTLSGCGQAVANMILPGIGSKIGRIAKVGKWAGRVARNVDKFTKNTRFAKRASRVVAVGNQIHHSTRHVRAINKKLKWYNRVEAVRSYQAAWRDVKDGWR